MNAYDHDTVDRSILRAVLDITGNELLMQRDPHARHGFTVHARCGTCRALWHRSIVVDDAMRSGRRALFDAVLGVASDHVCDIALGPAGTPHRDEDRA